MSDALFAWDYGTLPTCCTSFEYVTNPAELIRGEELYRMLRLCGIGGETGIESFSDWELFRDFCGCYPKLRGFFEAECMNELFCTAFPFFASPSSETAAALWKKGVEYLEEKPCSFSSFLPSSISFLAALDSPLPKAARGLAPMLNAQSLPEEHSSSLDAWQARIESAFERFSAKGCKKVLLRLPRNFSFVEPNPYAAGEALKKARRSREEHALLYAQLFRELCVNAQRFEWGILLECERDLDAIPLLAYAERTVKLPTLAIAVSSPCISRDMQSFLAATSPRLTLALSVSAFPTELELENAICSASARYPVGMLSFVVGGDLRLGSLTQEKMRCRICRILEKSLEKK